MAVNYTDFAKIWASASPLTPYSFTDANYTRGWDFVGSTPPSRQMWDAFMQHADEKLQYLYLHEDVPVGHEYFTFNPNVPQGSLPLFGGEYSRETYSALWSWVQQQTGYLKTEAEWQTLATANNGNVPYYSDGDGSTTFRVPALTCYIKAANGTVTEVGSYKAAGLPNITGSIRTRSMGTNSSAILTSVSGSFANGSTTETGYSVAQGTSGQPFKQVEFNASSSNSIYGNSTTVQPESVVGLWLVKAYGVIQDTGAINEQQYIDDRIATRLPLAGGNMIGNIAWAQGEVGYRPTTHTAPYDPCKQMIVTAGTVDSVWNDGNAKLALHTYDSSGINTAENGAFVLQASDGVDAPYLEGKPNGSLKWNGKDVITSALTGNVLSASGNMSTISTVTDACSILTHDAGVWLIIGHSDLSGGGSNVYNTYLTKGDNTTIRYVRNTANGGGGTIVAWVEQLTQNAGVKLRGYIPDSGMGTFRGNLVMVRLA